MILWSQQHKIISSIVLSFEKQEKTFAKTSGDILKRDKMFLNPSKYEIYPVADFKFVALWTVYKHSSSRIDTMKLMNNFTKDELKEILSEKQKFLLYENTIKQDDTVAKTKVLIPNTVIKLTKKGELSPLFMYKFFQDIEPQGRIQTRNVQRNNFLMSYFPTIQTYLKT